MAVISKRVGDKADTLAACMEMLLKFKALQQSPAHSNNPMLHLLYEWKIGGGYREDLIEALKCADLHQLADQVKVSDYRPASGVSLTV
uniref:Death domain-containing protein n=1 Tax=Amphimedon queenslandica TaxID=400682 RepID=A0A1X7URI4_AMPQE